MIRVLHLLDSSFNWEQRQGLIQLRDRLEKGFEHVVATVEQPIHDRLLPRSAITRHFACHPATRPLTSQSLARWINERNISIVQAWGSSASIIVNTGVQGCVPVSTAIFDPMLTDRDVQALRALLPLGPNAVVCSSSTVRRRLLERGVDSHHCVVVRPGVDFAAINALRRNALRWREQHAPNTTILMTAHAGMIHGGQDIAAHAASIRRYVDPGIRLIVPGLLNTGDPTVRRVTACNYPEMLLDNQQLVGQLGGAGLFEELLPVADVLILPAKVEVPTTALAWAMASSVLIMAGAVYSTAELLAHQQNALLLKPDEPKKMAFNIASLLGDLSLAARLKDTARGQAFEVFSVRRFVDQMSNVYANLLQGRSAAEGITDPALVA